MRRDFTEATRIELLKYIDDMSQESIWEKVWEGISAFVSFQWLKFLDSVDVTGEAQIREYHKEIVDARNYSKKQINKIFNEANAKDRRDAPKLNSDCYFASKLLRELETLTDIITPTGSLQNINTFKGALKALEDTSELVIEDGKLVYKIDPITEEKIVEHAMGNPGDDYHNIHRNTTKLLAEMGLTSMFWILLFNHKGIIAQEILYSSQGGQMLFDYMRIEIMKGRKGYDSIESIAKKLGVDEEYARYLFHEMGHPGQSVLPPKEYRNYDHLLYTKKINDIIYSNISKAINDSDFLEEFCKYAKLDQELTKLILDESGLSGYELSQYKKHLAKAIASTFEQIDPSESLADASGYREYIDIAKGFMNLGDDKELETMIDKWRNGKVEENELKNFLKDNCGYKTVTGKDIKDLENTFDFLDKFGKKIKLAGKTVEASENLAFLVSSYYDETRLLEQMIDADASNNPAYQTALMQLKNEYENKWGKILSGSTEEYLTGKLSDIGPKIPNLYSVAMDIALEVTDVKGYASSAQEIVSLSSIVPQTVDAYYEALNQLSDGVYDSVDVTNVRVSFEMMKQTSIDYYEAQIRYAQGAVADDRLPGTPEYDSYIEYLEDELSQIKKMQIGSKYKPRSYQEYMDQ